MPIDAKVTDTGDLDLTTGDLVLIEDEEELAQFCETKILTIKDEDAYNPEKGTDVFGVLFNMGVSDELRNLEIRSQISPIPEVKGVTSISYELGEDHIASIALNIDSVYGPLTAVGG